MTLLGPALSAAGLRFISAKARHGRDGMRSAEIVCASQTDVEAASEWAKRTQLIAVVRVGTDDEIAEAKRWEEIG
jgi:peptidyl-tRNA hydrolase